MKFEQLFASELEDRYLKCIQEDESLEGLAAEQAAAELGCEVFAGALFDAKYIKRCRLCGRLFTTRYKKAIYCSEMYEDVYRCKDIGAKIKRDSDPITRTLDKARRLHLRRRASSLAKGKSDATIMYDEWLKFALLKEKECRAGKMALEAFSEAIGKKYAADKGKDK